MGTGFLFWRDKNVWVLVVKTVRSLNTLKNTNHILKRANCMAHEFYLNRKNFKRLTNTKPYSEKVMRPQNKDEQKNAVCTKQTKSYKNSEVESKHREEK